MPPLSAIQGFRTVLRRGATPVTLCAIMLGILGVLAVFNATIHLPGGLHYVGRQALWLLLGSGVLLTIAGLPRSAVVTAGSWLVVPAYAGLAGVLVWGVRIRRMQGWYEFPGFLVQPSELAKPFFVFSVALALFYTARWRSRFWRGHLPLLGLLAAWIVPLVLQPDFGVVLVYGAAFAAMLVVAGTPLRHLGISLCAALPPIAAAWWTIPYLRTRVFSFLHPEQFAESAGWHILQFRRTLASGGPFGRTWGDCLWSRTHLPLGHTDSMFATIGEAMGFVGTVPLLLLLAAWIVSVCQRSQNADSPFAAVAAVGLMSIIAGQALIHLSVNLGLMPVTGLTLPLFSYGGSSMISTMACIGATECLLSSGHEPLYSTGSDDPPDGETP